MGDHTIAAPCTKAASCWILRRRDDRFEVAVTHDRGAGAVPAEAIRASLRAVAEADASPLTTALVDGLSVLIALARYHGTLNGAICIAREADAGPWDADQRALLAGVANHLGIAIAQITDRETLERHLAHRRAHGPVEPPRLLRGSRTTAESPASHGPRRRLDVYGPR